MSNDLRRFEQLRFAYLCGKLSPEEVAWMRVMLQAHPQLQAACDDDQHLIELSRGGVEEFLANAAPLVSFDRIAEALAVSSRPWWGARWAAALVHAWQRPMPTSWAAGTVTMLALVVGVQTVRLHQVDFDSPAAYRGSAPAAENKAGVTVIFADSLTLGELRALAASLQCEIVGGPDEEGRVRLMPALGMASARVVVALKANPKVLDAHETPGR